MVHKIKVIGIGPGSIDYLLPKALEAVQDCEVLVGSERALSLFQTADKETKIIDRDLKAIVDFIQKQRINKKVGVLVSGDPGFYSFLVFLKKHFLSEELEVIPGISSMQIAFSRLKLPWQNSYLLSAHGRDLENLQPFLKKRKTMGVLVDKKVTASDIHKLLKKWGSWQIHICTDLSYPEESIVSFSTEDFAPDLILENSVVVIEPNEK